MSMTFGNGFKNVVGSNVKKFGSRETNVSVQHFDLTVARQRKRKAPFLIKVTTAAALYRPLAVELFSVAESCVVELAVAFSREADGRVLIVGY